MEEPCLVIMPFGHSSIDRLFYDLVYINIILPAFAGAGVDASRIDREVVGDKPLSEAIERRLQTAPVVLADLSGNNPNVLFELGYRSAQAKPFVCISNDPSAAAFWSKTFQIIDYTAPDAQANISRAIGHIIADVNVRYRSEACLAELAERVRMRGGLDNTFQDRVAAWRIRQVREQIEPIQQREWEFEAHKPAAYVAFVFEGIMDLLEDGDEYLTVTNAMFWSDAAVGASAFLDKNIEATRRGAVIKRLFIIGKEEWESSIKRPELQAFLRDHKRALERVNKSGRGQMVVKCLLSDDLDRDLTRYGHFGFAHHPVGDDRTDDGCVVIVPRYESPVPGSSISHLRLIFSKGASSDMRTIEYLNKFKKSISDRAAIDLNTFLETEPVKTTRKITSLKTRKASAGLRRKRL